MKTISTLLVAGVSALALASAAQAADLIIDTPAPIAIEPGIVDVGGNWDGAFVGVFAGYGWADLDTDDDATTTDDLPLDPEGWLLGVNAGYNFSLGNNLVVGVVGDIAWADVTDTLDITDTTSVTSTIDWEGSLRGRVGLDAGAFLPYVTAGLAFAHNEVSFDTPDGTFSDDNTHVGWTAGAGVEFAATENMSVDLLYRYSDYGDQDYGDIGDDGELGLNSHRVSLGLNFRF